RSLLTTRQRHDDRSIALHVDRRAAIDTGARRMNRHRTDVLGNDIETIRNRNRRCGAPILRLQIVWLWPIAALILTGCELRRCRRRIADAKAVREHVDRADRWTDRRIAELEAGKPIGVIGVQSDCRLV